MKLKPLSVLVLLFAFSALAGEPKGVLPRARWWLQCRGWIAKPDRPVPDRVTVSGVEVPVPFGVPPDEFESHVDHWFLTNPDLQAVAFYGSRTHFSYGYLPDFETSDVDIAIFHPIFMDTMPLRGQINRAFRDFHVQTLSRLVGSHDTLLSERAVRFPTSAEEEKAYYELAEKRASRRVIRIPSERQEWRDLIWAKNPLVLDFEREQAREGRFNLFEPPPMIVIINKEALFFLREGKDAPVLAHGLRNLGYQNVVIWED